MFNFISDKKNQFIKWFYNKLAKHSLLHKKRIDVAIFEILGVYLTEIILGGDDNRRGELGEIQRKIEEVNKFIEFLKKL